MLKIASIVVLTASCAFAQSPAFTEQELSRPSTIRESTIETHFGITIDDPYRWMEDDSSERFTKWLGAQDAYTTSVLERIPGIDRLRDRVNRNAEQSSIRNLRRANGGLYYLRRDSPLSGSALVRLDLSTGKETQLLDPRLLGESLYAVIAFEPDTGSSRILVKVSISGLPAIKSIVVDGMTGEAIEQLGSETIESYWFGADLIVTKGDGVWRKHVIETAESEDKFILSGASIGGPDFAEGTSVLFRSSPQSNIVLALVSGPDDATKTVYASDQMQLQSGHPVWSKVAGVSEEIEEAFPNGESVYALSSRGEDGRHIIEFQSGSGGFSNKILIPAGQVVVQGIASAKDGLYLLGIEPVHHCLYRMDWETKKLQPLSLPAKGSIRGPIASPAEPGVIIGLESWDMPTTWFEVSDTVTRLPCNPSVRENGLRLKAELVYAVAKDGTKIPISIVRANDKQVANPPMWIMAYGAYGIAQTPRYLGGMRTYIEDGGIYAIAHVRGGGEFGIPWHRAGQGIAKPTAYLDLISCVEHLIAVGIADPKRIAIEGASGGGPVVGMLAMKRPELVQVVFDRVGDNNTLRLSATADGPYMVSEWGSPDDESGFKTLLAMDVTQHVKPNASYPSFYLTAGGRDLSVPAWMPGKLTAHLQFGSNRRDAALLRVDSDGGHLATPRVANAQMAEQIAFLYWQIGLNDYQPKGK